MHRITVIRHAKSDWTHDLPDHQRPLNPRGRRDAVRIGECLATWQITADLALISTAQRTRETWELVQQGWSPPNAEFRDDIYEASAHHLLLLIESLDESVQSVVLVAHNPGVSELVRQITGTYSDALSTSSIVVIDIPGMWASARGTGQEIHRAKPRG